MHHNKINSYEYLRQFTLDNLLKRKWNSTQSEWKAWIDSLNEYEVNCVACSIYIDPIVKNRYDSIRLEKLTAMYKNHRM